MNAFAERLRSEDQTLSKTSLEVLQVNLGKLCNLTCVHCHVEAGPTKIHENMREETAREVVQLMDRTSFRVLDLTGGAPEMNPHFRELVREARKRGLHVIDRCNLSVLFEKGQETLGEFLRDYRVEVIASLPCYRRENVDKQRGKGTFADSIRALQLLNGLGYGAADGEWTLNLVYNPVGPHLPPAQDELERDYKIRLKEDFGIVFNRLFTITNMPMTRYRKYLEVTGDMRAYEKLLAEHFNPAAVGGLMCRNTVSVSWDGKIYDCDFNQMMGMQMQNGKPLTLAEVTEENLVGKEVLTAGHCFGCTAGAGSSCQGALDV